MQALVSETFLGFAQEGHGGERGSSRKTNLIWKVGEYPEIGPMELDVIRRCSIEYSLFSSSLFLSFYTSNLITLLWDPYVMLSPSVLVRPALNASRIHTARCCRAGASSSSPQLLRSLPSLEKRRYISVYGYTQAKALVYSKHGEPKDVLQ